MREDYESRALEWRLTRFCFGFGFKGREAEEAELLESVLVITWP